MRVWSATPLPSAAVLWEAASGGWSLTTVVKATFDLQPGESPLAANQEPIHEQDVYEAGGVLRAPSDLAPYKVRPDVVLVGCAFAPRPVGSLVARMIVGTVDKAIEVHRARWVDDAGQVVEGAPFSTMPLGWQAAAGGRESVNPAGMSLDDVDRQGRTALPLQIAPGARTPSRGDYVEPVAFAPIPPGWPHRAHLAGVVGPASVGGAWYEAALPVDVHPAFFNVAPADQQPDYLADDPRIVLENLSPKATRLATTPAPVRVFAFVEGGRAAGRYAMRPDTLWIDTDRQIACVAYRATIPLGERDPGALATVVSDPPPPLTEPSRIVVFGGAAGDAPEARDADDDAASRQSTSTHLVATDGLPFSSSAASPPGVTGASTAGSGWAERDAPPPSPAPVAGLPFQRAPAHTRPIEATSGPSATPFEARAHTGANASAPPLGPPPGSPPGSPPGPPRGPSLGAPPPLGPPPLPKRRDASGTVPPPPPAPPLAPPQPAPPLAPPPLGSPHLASPPLAPPPPVAAPPLVAPPPAPSAPRPRAPEPPPPVPAPAPSQGGVSAQAVWGFQQQAVEPPKKIVHEARAALDGVAGASNAAADRGQVASGARPVGGEGGRPRVTSNDVVDLVWFDEEVPVRVQRQASWTDAVRDQRGVDDWVSAPEAPAQGSPDKGRRAVMRALARVPPTEPSTFSRLLAESVDEEGFVDRPLLVVAGELALQFDTIETLKASVELASQLGTSERLKEALDAAKDIAQAQRVSTPVVDGLLARLRKEFAQANRNLASDYLEATVQRTMLEERRYQKRQVLGGGHVVAHLLGAAGVAPTTVYLPDHLAPQLPVVQRFRARLLVEPHAHQHPSDGEGIALRTLALARVIGSRGRGGF